MTRSHRDEFKRAVRRAVIERAGGCCEACHAVLKLREGEIDHILPVELSGEPTAENARLLCKPCHKAKTAKDIARIRKSDRQRDKHSGAMPRKVQIPARRALTTAAARREQKRRDHAELAQLAAKIHPAQELCRS